MENLENQKPNHVSKPTYNTTPTYAPAIDGKRDIDENKNALQNKSTLLTSNPPSDTQTIDYDDNDRSIVDQMISTEAIKGSISNTLSIAHHTNPNNNNSNINCFNSFIFNTIKCNTNTPHKLSNRL